MDRSKGGSTPVGRVAVREALVDSATALFAERGTAAVSVRDIADAAGVNHALLFRHFGSKAGLERAVLARVADRVRQLLDGPDPWAAVERDRDLFTAIVARSLVEGDAEPMRALEHPVAGWLLADATAHGLSHDEAIRYAATVLALELGWRFFRPFVESATGLEPRPDGEAADPSLAGAIDAVRRALLSLDHPGAERPERRTSNG